MKVILAIFLVVIIFGGFYYQWNSISEQSCARTGQILSVPSEYRWDVSKCFITIDGVTVPSTSWRGVGKPLKNK